MNKPREILRKALRNKSLTIQLFRERLERLVRLCKDKCDPSNVFFLTHPHFRNLSGEYNEIVSNIVRKVCHEQGVHFINPKKEINAIYHSRFESYCEWPTDQHSHLTEDGYSLFGTYIGTQILRLSSMFTDEKAKPAPRGE